jgi:hypothetical protein
MQLRPEPFEVGWPSLPDAQYRVAFKFGTGLDWDDCRYSETVLFFEVLGR